MEGAEGSWKEDETPVKKAKANLGDVFSAMTKI
jgi:hypothetical protein